MLKDSISPIYLHFLPKAILNLPIAESKVDCQSCYRASSKYKGPWPYKDTLKCCTFHPFLPNYLVGGILKDNNFKELQKIIKIKIQAGTHALPIGLLAPLDYQIHFKNKKPQEFGQQEKFLCPYYDKKNNQCGIWPYRGVVCTTFFCQSSYGRRGKQLWKKINDYFSYVEAALLEEVLIQRGFSPRDISAQYEFLNYNSQESQLHLKSQKELQQWIGQFWRTYEDPTEFYIKSYEIIENLKPKLFKEIIGQMGLEIQEQLQKQAQEVY